MDQGTQTTGGAGEPFATVDELAATLSFPLDDPDARKVAKTALQNASTLARYYGADWPDPNSAPPIVKVVVLNAARRCMTLIDGLVMSQSGDERVSWTDMQDKTGTIFLNDTEQAQCRGAAGRNRSFWSVGVFAYENTPTTPKPQPVWGNTNRTFPLYAEE